MNFIHRDESAIYYESGYSCDNAIFIKLGSESFFITDGRYEIEAKEKVQNAYILIDRDINKKAMELLKNSKIKKIAYDPKEWECYSFSNIKRDLKVKWKPILSLSHKKRIIKSSSEIKKIKQAVKIGRDGFNKVLELFKVSGTKKDEFYLNHLAKNILSDFGKFPLSFEPIVAVGSNSSKPHALPTKKRLNRNDILLMDAGVKYKRYCSDRTRTIQFNEYSDWSIEQKFNSKKHQKIYDIVKKAHNKAIKKAKVGMRAKDIDKIARDVIEKAGFGKYFVHSTGHGVGLDIHELPNISAKSDTVIENGMVFTVEPGIYIQDFFGVRIEDMVVMKNGKAETI